MKHTLSKIKTKEIIQQELYYRSILEEGLWDDVKIGTKKLIQNTAKNAVTKGLLPKAKTVIDSMTTLPKNVQFVIDALKVGMKETGDSITLDSNLQLAKQIGQLNHQKMGDILVDDLKGPVKDKAAALQNESWIKGVTPILLELNVSLNEIINSKKQTKLNESGILGIFGMSLAGFGAINLVLKGLAKLANYMGAKKTAAVLNKIHHMLHSFEEKVISKIVPDRLSFVVYKVMKKRGFSAQNKVKRALTQEEYNENYLGVKTKVEKIIYSAFLLFLAFNGIKAAVHAGYSLLGVAEGSASVVKGIEIGQAAAHIADIIDLGVDEASSMVQD